MIIGTINWSNALIVTLLGFSLVFCLLVLLVFILMLFGVIMKVKKEPEVKPHSADKQQSATEPAPVAEASEADMAAIAMAVSMLYDDECDEGAGKLTIKAKPTVWNSKIYGINNLDR